jgi:tagatose 6-phosphate kinase
VILTAGLSPAWQRIMVFDDFKIGEVNRAQNVVHCASGKVLNVAVGLKTLEADVICLSSIGGDSAAAIQHEFAEMEILTHWIETSAKTRTCITVLDQLHQKTTELVENAESITPQELDSWVTHFHQLASQSSLIVISGSLPAGAPATLFSDLLKQHQQPSVLDIRREELVSALLHHPLVIKPNREEVEQTVGRSLSNHDDLVAAAEELRSAGAEWVVVTDGPNPVTIVGPEERCLIPVPTAKTVVNPIGCGDSLTAGIAAAMNEGRSILEAVKWGIACSSQNLESLLPARLNRQQMIELASQLTVERLV